MREIKPLNLKTPVAMVTESTGDEWVLRDPTGSDHPNARMGRAPLSWEKSCLVLIDDGENLKNSLLEVSTNITA